MLIIICRIVFVSVIVVVFCLFILLLLLLFLVLFYGRVFCTGFVSGRVFVKKFDLFAYLRISKDNWTASAEQPCTFWGQRVNG